MGIPPPAAAARVMQFGISPYSINMIQLQTLELGRGWQAQWLLPRQTCFEQHLWGDAGTSSLLWCVWRKSMRLGSHRERTLSR